MQRFRHIPQFALLSSGVSHPLLAIPSQSSKPALHVSMHDPVAHDAVAFVPVHARAQAAQFIAVLSGVSHPLGAMRSQSPIPAGHIRAHIPAVQTAGAPVADGQDRPHMPQLVTVVSGVSQPVPGIPSQSPNPVEHITPHTPIRHCATAFAPPAGHARPHIAQLPTSIARSVQTPRQAV